MAKPISILHVSNVAGRRGGGISEVAQALLRYIQHDEIESDLWFAGGTAEELEVAEDSEVISDRIKGLSLLQFLNPLFLKKVVGFASRYSLIHQHGVFLPTSVISSSVHRSVPVIISPHGLLEPEKLRVSPVKKALSLALYENKNLQRCSCFIACSLQEAHFLKDFGVTQPIAVVPNGVAVDSISLRPKKDKSESFRLRHKISSDAKVLLFLSRIHPFKGLDLAIEAIAAVAQEFRRTSWVFVIAGIDENNYESTLKDKVKEKDLEDIVRFIGPQYSAQKLEALDSADCFVLPSKGENFGIVVVEALARGLPVITTSNTPWKELETRNCGWWVDRSKNSFVSVLQRLFSTDKEVLEVMGRNGVRLVEEKYTWPIISQQISQVYKWVLNDFDDEFSRSFLVLNDDADQ